jgi:hypothetical protein
VKAKLSATKYSARPAKKERFNMFSTAPIPHHMIQRIRDLIIPNVLAFRANMSEEYKAAVKEIRIIHNMPPFPAVNSNEIFAFIRIDGTDMAKLATELKEQFDHALSINGIKSITTVYSDDWLNHLSNAQFKKAIQRSVLVFSNAPQNIITVKSLFDACYEAAQEGREAENQGREALYEFITGFPMLDHVHMQEAIREKPVKYDELDASITATVIEHLKDWANRFCLYLPEWARRATIGNAPPLPGMASTHYHDWDD